MYDPDERINKLADEVDNEAPPLSRLSLFSPCKVSQRYSICYVVISLSILHFLAICIEFGEPIYLLQINVFLRITNKREDGFHDLASLFHVSSFKFIIICCFRHLL